VCVCVCVADRLCCMKGCACTITATSETPSTEGISKSKRQQLQQQQFGQCRGHQLFMPMPSVMFYIADILHNLLRIVGARRRRSGGGPGGGCARMPVGIPSPPRGGRWKPRSRASLGTVGG
jgi:uncharacterized protein YceK